MEHFIAVTAPGTRPYFATPVEEIKPDTMRQRLEPEPIPITDPDIARYAYNWAVEDADDWCAESETTAQVWLILDGVVTIHTNIQ